MPVPFLQSVNVTPDHREPARFPFTLPLFAQPLHLTFRHPVTFFVGENGSGKSTLLEAIADKAGFHVLGGNRNHLYQQPEDQSPLAPALRCSWKRKTTQGFFLRAESFFHFATYLEEVAQDEPSVLHAYGGKSLHAQSHGESFLSLFEHKFQDGLFLLDEPEAALSPSRQLTFLTILHELIQSGSAQLIIATHSPLLFSYPGATVLQFDGQTIQEVAYQDTEHYQLMRRFLDSPERYFRHLF